MKKPFPLLVCLILQISTIADAQSKKRSKGSPDSAIPPGAAHIVLKSVDDAKQFFTYSPTIAIPEVPQPQDGLYRIEVNEKGKVAAVTILKGISPNADTWVIKELVAWYAKPGPLRIVDVPVPTAVAKPFEPEALEIVATDVVAEAQVTWVVRSCVELSE